MKYFPNKMNAFKGAEPGSGNQSNHNPHLTSLVFLGGPGVN